MAVVEGLARAAWRALVPSFFNLGFSFRGAMAATKVMGYPLRTQTALADWRELTGLLKGMARARTVDPTIRFPQAYMSETDVEHGYKYRVHGSATYRNIATGEETTKRVSMYTNRWLSREGWGKEFERWKEKTEYETGWSISNVDFVGVEHQAGFSY